MPWVRRHYRTNKVWVLVDEEDHLVLDERGLASLRYKPDDERTYTTRPAEIGPVPPEKPDDTIRAWVSVHPEPPRVGALLDWRGRQREVQLDLETEGPGDVSTRAMLAVLGEIRRKELPLRLHVADPVVMEQRARTGPGYEPALAAAVARFSDLVFVQALPGDETARTAVLAAPA